MNYQYKITVCNRILYREFELAQEMERIKIGTTTACEIRLRQDLFFAPIELEFEKNKNKWKLSCSDELYISKGDMRKLITTEVAHGDILSIRYSHSGQEAFELRFMIDFEAEIPDYNWKVDLRQTDSLTISGNEDADLIILNQFGKLSQIRLKRNKTDFVLEEVQSNYGTYLNGRKIEKETKLNDSDFFSTGGASFYYKDQELYFEKKNVTTRKFPMIEVHHRVNQFKYPLFNRNTRIKRKIDTTPINIVDPPAVIQKPKANIVMNLMPSLAMLALTIVVRGIMSTSNGSYIIFSVCSMGIGILTSVISFISDRRGYKKDCKERISTYKDYIEKKKIEIAKAREQEQSILRDTYYDINQDLLLVDNFESSLFDRMEEDEDFLDIYLGTGQIRSKQLIEYKKKETLAVNDELADMIEEVQRQYEYINDAPVILDLKKTNAVGIIGSKEENYQMFKNMVLDLSIRHYYKDVSLFVLIDDDKTYEWIRLLPHLRNDQGRYQIVCDNESRNNHFEYLYKELSMRNEHKEMREQYIVVLVMKEHGIKNHPLSKFIEKAMELKVVFVFFEEAREDIPLHCQQIIQLKEDHTGVLYEADNQTKVHKFQYKTVSDEKAVRTVEKLAPVYCEQISLESSLRKNISLYELLHIYEAEDINLDDRWNTSKIYESMAVPLGVNAMDEIVSLNLHEKAHGPHGLVAGTTGSGKSEILQTYILSAATLFHPYEIGFVIIDFKGGGMVNQFKELPHLIGAITNIDGKEIDRSLKSIKAELLKRQNLFAEAKVNHIDKYINLYKQGKVSIPLPHLVIIVDEFAELKAEQPEFMKELISAARIGRSLGIHLILATQKPAGQVNEQIWSNSKFKLCLKVQNQEDSKEVLKSPLAAEIREPGRAYLQVGNNEIFELFQSAYSGGPAETDNVSDQKKYQLFEVDFAGRRHLVYEKKPIKTNKNVETELEAIVKYIAQYCKTEDIQRLPSICLPSLTELVTYTETEVMTADKEMLIPIGIYDDPDNQYQGDLYTDIGHENTIIVGASQMGKTNLLQLIIRYLADHNSPEEVNFYIMDFGSMVLKNFENLYHVGGVVLASEDEKLKNLMKLLITEIDSRKDRLMKKGISSYGAYKEAGGCDMPKIYLMLDNYNAFKELYLDKYEGEFLKICRDGITLGITIIITNSTSNGIGYRHLSNFSNRICFTCSDTAEYSTMLERCKMEPKNIPGRALLTKNKNIYETQVYLAFKGEREIDRVMSVHSYVEQKNQKYASCDAAKQIPCIPDILTRKMFIKSYGSSINHCQLPLGLDFATIDPIVMDLSEEIEISMISKKREPVLRVLKSFLQTIALNSLSEKAELYIMDDFNRSLAAYKDYPLTQRYTMDSSESELILSEVLLKLQQIKQLTQEENSNTNSPRLFVIINSKDAIEYISTTKPVLSIFNDIIKNYKNFGVTFLYCDVDDAAVPYSGPELLKRIKDSRKAIIFDNLGIVKMFDISSNLVRSYAKPLLSDEAYLMNGTDISKVKLITEEG